MHGAAAPPAPAWLQGEINDVKVSADAAHVATCSTDCYLRVWSLRPETLGEPVAAMRLPGVQANFLHWHPKVPNVLAYVNAAGVCGVWDATLGGGEVQLSPAYATFAARSIGLSQRALVAAAGDHSDQPVGAFLCDVACAVTLSRLHGVGPRLVDLCRHPRKPHSDTLRRPLPVPLEPLRHVPPRRGLACRVLRVALALCGRRGP